MSEKKDFLAEGDEFPMDQKKKMISMNAMISLTAMMFLILILFQVSASSVEFFQEEKYRQIVNEKRLTLKDKMKGENSTFSKQKKISYILLTGNGEIPVAVTEGLIALKDSYEAVTSLDRVVANAQQAERLIIYNKYYSEKDIENLMVLAGKGVDLIFAALPDTFEHTFLMNLLGIDEVQEKRMDTDGMRVLEDFMLGGRSDYKKLPVKEIPWLQLKGSTKTYMCGLFKDVKETEIKNEELPPLAWRNRFGSAYVFAFNGNFMRENSNVGMFISALANMEDTFLYPAINARVLFVNNFPYLTSENKEEMQKQYSMSARRFLEDYILPDLVAITEKTKDVISAAGNLSFDKEKETSEEINHDTLQSFQNTLLKQSGEIGLSFYDRYDSRKKINSNLEFFCIESNMKFPFFYGGGLSQTDIYKIKDKIPEAGTVIRNWEEIGKTIFQFLENDLVSVPVTSNGYAYSDEENLKLKNAMTGLGVSNHRIDMEDVVYPKNSKDNWRYQSVELGKNLDTYWKPYQIFDAVSLSEEGKRVREYLLMDYHYEVSDSGNEAYLQIENFHNKLYFLLRSNKELIEMEGGNWVEAGEGAYLLTIEQKQVNLIFKDVNDRK